MPLALTPGLAKSILYASEGRFGGHTLERHVNISNDDLRRRYEHSHTSGNILLFTAFTSVDQCADALSDTINHLGQTVDYFRVFYKQNNGDKFARERIALNKPYRVRTGRGPMELNHFTLWAQKIDGAGPHDLHIISFFATMLLVDTTNTGKMINGKPDPNYSRYA